MKAKTITKNVLFTIAFPVIMFFTMWILCAIKGVGDVYMGSALLVYSEKYIAVSVIMALAIFSQFRNGRFDFSGGAIVVVASIIAGNVAQYSCNGNLFVYFILCVGISLALSLIVATVYCFSRVPIVIITIAMALVYEALTYVIFKSEGINIISSGIAEFFGSGITSSIKNPGLFPGLYIPLIIALALFIVFTYKTKWGKEAQMLANNQKVACNNGINEIKSVYATYIVTGILLGLGAVIYGCTNIVKPQANLSTAGVLFQYIVPVFMGMYFGSKSKDYWGIIVSAIGLAFLNYGLKALGLGAGGVSQIVMGCFTLLIYSLGTISGAINKLVLKIKSKKNVEEAQ